jgi:hypothetical protein
MVGGGSTSGVKVEEFIGRSDGGNLICGPEEQGHNGQDRFLGAQNRDLVSYVTVKDEQGKEHDDSTKVEVEVDLDDEELAPTSFLTMARYYSGNRFSERGLFDDAYCMEAAITNSPKDSWR